MKLLLLEDDAETARALAAGLTREGHSVSTARDVPGATSLLESDTFDIAVLDVMVPGGSGYDVLERLRSGRKSTLVLMLTARGSVADRVEGLDRGADDFLVKPFSFAELTARLRALERRREASQEPLRCGPLEIDPIRRAATVTDTPLDLTPTEFSLLSTLLIAAGACVSRSELLREVWGYEFEPGTNVVDVHINRLRRKLEDAGAPELIRTLRGRGYAAG